MSSLIRQVGEKDPAVLTKGNVRNVVGIGGTSTNVGSEGRLANQRG